MHDLKKEKSRLGFCLIIESVVVAPAGLSSAAALPCPELGGCERTLRPTWCIIGVLTKPQRDKERPLGERLTKGPLARHCVGCSGTWGSLRLAICRPVSRAVVLMSGSSVGGGGRRS